MCVSVVAILCVCLSPPLSPFVCVYIGIYVCMYVDECIKARKWPPGFFFWKKNCDRDHLRGLDPTQRGLGQLRGFGPEGLQNPIPPWAARPWSCTSVDVWMRPRG
jgi:hypothetical protein